MNTSLKTILLTLLTLSVFTIALIEVSGISTSALYNKLGMNNGPIKPASEVEKNDREKKIETMPKTEIEVLEKDFDFGNLKDGDVVKHDYVVKNIGKEPLLIAKIQTSCGCTAPSFPKEPILPNQTAVVTLEFNSSGKIGKVEKGALIVANATNAPFPLHFKAFVKE